MRGAVELILAVWELLEYIETDIIRKEFEIMKGLNGDSKVGK